MLWIISKENGIFGFLPHPKPTHCYIGLKESKWEGAAIDVSNQTRQTLTGSRKIFMYNIMD